MTDDRDQQEQGELIFNEGEGNGEARAKYAPLPAAPTPTEPGPATDETGDTSDDVALEKTVDIKFTRLPDGTIVGQAPAMDGLPPYNFKLQKMTWGLFEDIENMQNVDDDKRMGTMLAFLTTYVVGGPRSVPLEHTRTIFEAITAYASLSMDSSKN